jgi:hypothetical protein
MTTGANGNRSYVTRYNTISDPIDHIFLIDSKQLDQSSSDINSPNHPSISASIISAWSEGGILYLARNATTSTLNQIYSMPIAAHLDYGDNLNNVLITPRIATTNANKLYKIYVNEIKKIGSDTLGIPLEQYKVYYRTSGISDNTGSWSLISDDGNLSFISPSTHIQFKFVFSTINHFMIPSRLLSLCVVYEDNTGDSHYEPSRNFSDISTNRFAYRQSSLFNMNIPNLRIRLFNAVTGVIIIDDTVLSSAFGTFEYSNNNGSTWNSWNNTQDNIGNYIRYTANTLPAGTRIRAILTQS